MTKEKLQKKIVALFKEKEKIEKEIEKLQNQLVQQLCPKEKQECEPTYCTFRVTETCPFLEEWHEILEKAQVPKDTKYDLVIDFVEKILEEKAVPKNNT